MFWFQSARIVAKIRANVCPFLSSEVDVYPLSVHRTVNDSNFQIAESSSVVFAHMIANSICLRVFKWFSTLSLNHERFLKKSLDHGEQNSPFPMVERFLKKPLDHGEQNILNPGKNREVSFSRSPGFRIFYSPWPSGFFKNRSAIGLQNILFPMAERFFQKPLGHGMHNTRWWKTDLINEKWLLLMHFHLYENMIKYVSEF